MNHLEMLHESETGREPPLERTARRPRLRAAVRIAACAFAGVLVLALALPAPAAPRVGSVEAFWEDSLAVIQPEIRDPLDASMRRTLRSGVPVVVELEVRFVRTGYAFSERVPVRVEYDVWTGWYHVHTPLSPLAIDEYSTVLRLFERDLVLPFPERDVEPDRAWFVKVRAGARIAETDADGGDPASGVEEELTGFARLLFRLFGAGSEMGEWSDLVKLPERGGGE